MKQEPASDQTQAQAPVAESSGFFGTLYDYSLGPVVNLIWGKSTPVVTTSEVKETVSVEQKEANTVESDKKASSESEAPEVSYFGVEGMPEYKCNVSTANTFQKLSINVPVDDEETAQKIATPKVLEAASEEVALSANEFPNVVAPPTTYAEAVKSKNRSGGPIRSKRNPPQTPYYGPPGNRQGLYGRKSAHIVAQGESQTEVRALRGGRR